MKILIAIIILLIVGVILYFIFKSKKSTPITVLKIKEKELEAKLKDSSSKDEALSVKHKDTTKETNVVKEDTQSSHDTRKKSMSTLIKKKG